MRPRIGRRTGRGVGRGLRGEREKLEDRDRDRKRTAYDLEVL